MKEYRLKCFYLGALFLEVLFSQPAAANVITNTITVPGANTLDPLNVTLPLFDSSLGTLNGVTISVGVITFTWVANDPLTGQNCDSGCEIDASATATTQITVPDGTDYIDSTGSITAMSDPGGLPFSEVFTSVSSPYTRTVTSALLSQYDAATQGMSDYTASISYADSAGCIDPALSLDCMVDFRNYDAYDISVSYDYTPNSTGIRAVPEPPTLFLLPLGITAGLLIRRKVTVGRQSNWDHDRAAQV